MHTISIAFVYLKSKKDSSYKSNQSYRKYPVYLQLGQSRTKLHALLKTDLPETIYPV